MSDRFERLVNLVIALRETRRPMTAAEVREQVAGYDGDGEAFRRTFERDKADLRDLGVPIRVEPVSRFDDRQGYRIEPADYDLPPVPLEPQELAALALALAATGLADDAGAGLAKLSVDSDWEPPDGAAAPVVEVELDAPHRDQLMAAQVTRTPVRFRYRPAGRGPLERRVDPHALVHRGGQWYLVGFDHARQDRRAFRLDRIDGTVRAAGEPGAFPVPDGAVAADDVVPPVPVGGPQQAEVLVVASLVGLVARRALGGGRPGDGGRTAFTVPVGRPEDFLGWALELGPDLEIRAPAELRRAAIARLTAAAATPGAA